MLKCITQAQGSVMKVFTCQKVWFINLENIAGTLGTKDEDKLAQGKPSTQTKYIKRRTTMRHKWRHTRTGSKGSETGKRVNKRLEQEMMKDIQQKRDNDHYI